MTEGKVMQDAVLEVKDLEIAFEAEGGRGLNPPVVKGVTFSVRAGECAALVGESGAGKSMAAKAVMSLLPQGGRVTGGSIALCGRSVLNLPEDELCSLRGREIGMVFQDPLAALNPLHRAGDQVAEAFLVHAAQTGITRAEAWEKTRELFEKVRIDNPEKAMKAYPHELSGGQRQRVVIAMAVANRPRLLIADEPTTALDASVQRSVMELLLSLAREEGIALLLISHDLPMVKRTADVMHVMRGGRIIETLAPGDAPREDYTKLLLGAGPHRFADESRSPEFLEGLRAGTLPPVIETKGLAVEYRRRGRGFFSRAESFWGLEPIDLTVSEGECLGIVGESGSGKSTLAMAILRLIDSKGRVFFRGKEISGLSGRELRLVRQKIQVVFQDPFSSLNPRLSCGEIVGEGLAAAPVPVPAEEAARRTREALKDVGIPEDYLRRYPHELSGGERQRIAIARALVMNPEVLVLDEPTTSLDRALQFQVIGLLRDLQAKRSLTCLYISHDLALVREFADRLIVLQSGRCAERGMARDAFEHPKSECLRRLLETSFDSAPAAGGASAETK